MHVKLVHDSDDSVLLDDMCTVVQKLMSAVPTLLTPVNKGVSTLLAHTCASARQDFIPMPTTEPAMV